VTHAGDSWRGDCARAELVLVCDVGGGTTDFSLILVSERDGDLSLERVAIAITSSSARQQGPGARRLVQHGSSRTATARHVAVQTLWHQCRVAKRHCSRSRIATNIHHRARKGSRSSAARFDPCYAATISVVSARTVLSDVAASRCRRAGAPAACRSSACRMRPIRRHQPSGSLSSRSSVRWRSGVHHSARASG